LSQLNYPVQKITTEGDTLVIFTKQQADKLKATLQSQANVIKELKTKYKKIKSNHINLIEEYSLVKAELARTISYNDSFINYLGSNMALLYKTSDSSDVYYVDLKYYMVDVFKKGTIFLTSMGENKRKELNAYLALYPEWRYININNEFNDEFRLFIETLKLYPHRNEYVPTLLSSPVVGR
jgi:hypothetical protein